MNTSLVSLEIELKENLTPHTHKYTYTGSSSKQSKYINIHPVKNVL